MDIKDKRMLFGKRLKELRSSTGDTVKSLGEKVGVSGSAIMETNKSLIFL